MVDEFLKQMFESIVRVVGVDDEPPGLIMRVQTDSFPIDPIFKVEKIE